MFRSSSGPILAKKSLSSSTISIGLVLSFILFMVFFLSVFCSNRLRAFHNFPESPLDSWIEFWKKSRFSSLFSDTVLLRALLEMSLSHALFDLRALSASSSLSLADSKNSV